MATVMLTEVARKAFGPIEHPDSKPYSISYARDAGTLVEFAIVQQYGYRQNLGLNFQVSPKVLEYICGPGAAVPNSPSVAQVEALHIGDTMAFLATVTGSFSEPHVIAEIQRRLEQVLSNKASLVQLMQRDLRETQPTE